MAAKRGKLSKKRLKLIKCLHCGAPLSDARRRRHAVTCSAICANERERLARLRPVAKQRMKHKVVTSGASSRKNPPTLGLTLTEAAKRVGISRTMAHLLCVRHGLGRNCNDGKFWLTLDELRTLTARPWKDQSK
ncbi:MAG TPA: hypothetical protein VND64_08245 [Pirellulales bacterium]|nr:hypothetical protein [Pirellulales bacterium]